MTQPESDHAADELAALRERVGELEHLLRCMLDNPWSFATVKQRLRSRVSKLIGAQREIEGNPKVPWWHE